MPETDAPTRADAQPRADAARNRERLLHAARSAIADGDRSLQLNDIARRAGVGVGTAYRHFPTPRALLETLVQEQIVDLLGQARRDLAEPDAWLGLSRLLTAGVALMVSDPGFAEVMAAGDDALAQTTSRKSELWTAVAGLIRRARDSGELRPEVEVADIVRLMCGVSYAARLGDDAEPGARAGGYATWLVDGLRTPRP